MSYNSLSSICSVYGEFLLQAFLFCSVLCMQIFMEYRKFIHVLDFVFMLSMALAIIYWLVNEILDKTNGKVRQSFMGL